MNEILNSLSQKDIRTLIKRIIIINIVFIVIILTLNIYIDFEELHKKLSLDEVLEYQTTVIIVLFLLEVGIIIAVILEWFRSRRVDIAALDRLVREGENENTELKASFRWDYKANKVNKELEHVIVKTIDGFMNTKGGTLLIGVDDERALIGLDRDYQTLKKENSDGFLIHLTQIINNYLGKEFSAFWSASIVRIKNVDICRIDVFPADKPVFVRYNNQEEFFVRVSATIQPMQIKEAHEYIKMHWKD